MNRAPDQVIDAPIEFEVPGPGEVPTFTVWSRLPFRDDRFVEALQLAPTNRHVVHHASLSLGDLPPKTKLGQATLWPGGPVLTGVPLLGDGQPYGVASNEEFGYPLVFYVPGGGFLRFPQGIAKRLRRGQYLSWGMHYMGHGHGRKDPHAPRRLVRQARRSPRSTDDDRESQADRGRKRARARRARAGADPEHPANTRKTGRLPASSRFPTM